MASITIPLWSFIVLCICAGIFILFAGLAIFSMVLDYIEEHRWQIRYKRYLKAKKKGFHMEYDD